MPLVSGWVVFWNPASIASFARNVRKMDEALPEWISVDAEGEAVRRTTNPKERREFLALAKREGVRVYGMASNFAEKDFDPDRLHRMLIDPARRSRHAATLVRIAKEDRLDGIDLDYESLKAEDREPFSLFVEVLGYGLRKAGKRLSVTVHPKFEEPGNWDGPKAQDLVRIGKAADVVRVMTYDQHGPWSEPGPIAADEWVERVARFFLTKIPAKKLDLGVPWYGYDWTPTPPVSIVWEDRDWTGATVDPASGEWLKGKARFGGSDGFRRRRSLAERLGLRGTSSWYVGSEDPAVWSAITPRPNRRRSGRA